LCIFLLSHAHSFHCLCHAHLLVSQVQACNQAKHPRRQHLTICAVSSVKSLSTIQTLVNTSNDPDLQTVCHFVSRSMPKVKVTNLCHAVLQPVLLNGTGQRMHQSQGEQSHGGQTWTGPSEGPLKGRANWQSNWQLLLACPLLQKRWLNQQALTSKDRISQMHQSPLVCPLCMCC